MRCTREVHAHEVHAHDIHAYEIHTHEMYACEVRAMRYTVTLMRYMPMSHTLMRHA